VPAAKPLITTASLGSVTGLAGAAQTWFARHGSTAPLTLANN
jgi:hypothetical protein